MTLFGVSAGASAKPDPKPSFIEDPLTDTIPAHVVARSIRWSPISLLDSRMPLIQKADSGVL
ncbi:hypothetical protein CWS72_26155 [Telmatospirillum siberiense]|uniref:Uncharacterized protein n=1 Tax=Telmatospirillum siberiense TaxID=382514 RepID=A0A2N3PMD8_9PROT|nr:hypothetical protein CWS72_26155 [Telmatospirillum siberiense]